MSLLFNGYGGVTPIVDIGNPPALDLLSQHMKENDQYDAHMRSQLIAQQEALYASQKSIMAFIAPLNPPLEIVELCEDSLLAISQNANLLRNNPQEDTAEILQSKKQMSEQLSTRAVKNMDKVQAWLSEQQEKINQQAEAEQAKAEQATADQVTADQAEDDTTTPTANDYEKLAAQAYDVARALLQIMHEGMQHIVEFDPSEETLMLMNEAIQKAYGFLIAIKKACQADLPADLETLKSLFDEYVLGMLEGSSKAYKSAADSADELGRHREAGVLREKAKLLHSAIANASKFIES